MRELRSFIYEEDGLGTIEIAILIAALVALAIVFRKQLGNIWQSIGNKMGEKAGKAATELDNDIQEVGAGGP